MNLFMPGGASVTGLFTNPPPSTWNFLASDSRLSQDFYLLRDDAIRFAADAKGKFSLRAPRTEACNLAVLVPMPLSYADALLLPIGEQPADKEDVEWKVDLATARPGKIAGKIVLPIDGFSMNRLAIVSLDDRFNVQRPGNAAFRARSSLAADGSFFLHLRPGSHLLTVLDLVTKVRLLTEARRIEIEPGESKELSWELPTALLRLVLTPEDGPEAAIALEVLPESPEQTAAQERPYYASAATDGWISRDFWLPLDGVDRIDVLVPAGPNTVRLLSRDMSAEKPEDASPYWQDPYHEYSISILAAVVVEAGEELLLELTVPGMGK